MAPPAGYYYDENGQLQMTPETRAAQEAQARQIMAKNGGQDVTFQAPQPQAPAAPVKSPSVPPEIMKSLAFSSTITPEQVAKAKASSDAAAADYRNSEAGVSPMSRIVSALGAALPMIFSKGVGGKYGIQGYENAQDVLVKNAAMEQKRRSEIMDTENRNYDQLLRQQQLEAQKKADWENRMKVEDMKDKRWEERNYANLINIANMIKNRDANTGLRGREVGVKEEDSKTKAKVAEAGIQYKSQILGQNQQKIDNALSMNDENNELKREIARLDAEIAQKELARKQQRDAQQAKEGDARIRQGDRGLDISQQRANDAMQVATDTLSLNKDKFGLSEKNVESQIASREGGLANQTKLANSIIDYREGLLDQGGKRLDILQQGANTEANRNAWQSEASNRRLNQEDTKLDWFGKNTQSQINAREGALANQEKLANSTLDYRKGLLSQGLMSLGISQQRADDWATDAFSDNEMAEKNYQFKKSQAEQDNAFRREESAREQENINRNYQLQEDKFKQSVDNFDKTYGLANKKFDLDALKAERSHGLDMQKLQMTQPSDEDKNIAIKVLNENGITSPDIAAQIRSTRTMKDLRDLQSEFLAQQQDARKVSATIDIANAKTAQSQLEKFEKSIADRAKPAMDDIRTASQITRLLESNQPNALEEVAATFRNAKTVQGVGPLSNQDVRSNDPRGYYNEFFAWQNRFSGDVAPTLSPEQREALMSVTRGIALANKDYLVGEFALENGKIGTVYKLIDSNAARQRMANYLQFVKDQTEGW